MIIFSLLGASALPESPLGRRDTATALLEIMIGAALIVLGVVQLRRRSRTERAGLPRWLSAVDSFGALASFADCCAARTSDRKGCCSGWLQGLRCTLRQ